MTTYDVNNEYFKWLYGLIFEDEQPEGISYKKLLMHLHNVEFKYSIVKDQNRAEDGISLRWRFICDRDSIKPWESDPEYVLDLLNGPCSILEMMIALSLRCETDIMDDPTIGNRTSQWFRVMLVNLGLGGMTDVRYDQFYVHDILDKFLHREYEPDGTGGLFTIKHCIDDLREVEIWVQLLWYLDSLLDI